MSKTVKTSESKIEVTHVTLAQVAADVLAKAEGVLNVSAVNEHGQRLPRAAFTVIGADGAVYQAQVKRVVAPQG